MQAKLGCCRFPKKCKHSGIKKVEIFFFLGMSFVVTGKFHIRLRIRVVVFVDEEKPHSFQLNFGMYMDPF